MGTDWNNIAGIGLVFEFPKSMVPTETQESCEHPERVGQAFCPVCGKKVYSYEVRDTSGIDEAVEAIGDALPRTYVVREIDPDGLGDPVFIGYGIITSHQGGPYAESLPLPDVAEVERTIMAALEPYGAVVKRPFGVHSFMVGS